jgi:GNAT superfamily N-acetyltransferase
MDIRRAVPDDVESVLSLINELSEELGGESIPPEIASQTFSRLVSDQDTGFILVVEEESTIVGVCTVSFQDAIRSRGRYAIIQETYVVPEFRSLGLGGKLVYEAISQAQSSSCSMVEVGTPAGGARQEAFYGRLGFQPVGLRLRKPLESG